MEAVQRKEVSVWWEGFVKQVSLQWEVKEWGNFGWEWWVNRGRSDSIGI